MNARTPQESGWRSRSAHLVGHIARHPYESILVALCVALVATGWRIGFADLIGTPDQRGRWQLEHGHYKRAAEAFRDPMWLGVAQMKAGDFKAAAQTFGGLDTAQSAYDQGNALVMLGKYQDAITRYSRALALAPDYADAEANRALATLRAERLKPQPGQPGEALEPGEPGDRDELPPRSDKEDADVKSDNPGSETVMSDEAIRELWLKRVDTRPADFLRSRFAFQLQAASAPKDAAPPGTPPQ